MKTSVKARYQVRIRETNEIDGETFTSDVPVFCCPSMTKASEWAKAKWGMNPPVGARIRDSKDGSIYHIFG